MKKLKNILSITIQKLFFFKRISSFIFDKKYNKVKKVNHNGVDFSFHVPNWITLYRAETFSEKEPETFYQAINDLSVLTRETYDWKKSAVLWEQIVKAILNNKN